MKRYGYSLNRGPGLVHNNRVMNPQQVKHSRIAQGTTQVVDPFVVAKRPTAAAGAPVARKTPDSTQPPASPAYRPPAGPLHVRYMPDVRAPQPTRPNPHPVKAPAVTAVPRPATPHPPVRPVAGDIRPARPVAGPAPAGPEQADKVQTAKAKPASRPWSFEEQETWRDRPGKVALLAIGGLLLGALSLFSLELGQIVLAIYAIVAVWRGWASRQAFAIALGVFGGIVITSLHSSWRPLADNLAVYAFLLLCVGTVLMWLEMRRESRSVRAVSDAAPSRVR